MVVEGDLIIDGRVDVGIIRPGQDQGGKVDCFLCRASRVPQGSVVSQGVDVLASHPIVDDLDDESAKAGIRDKVSPVLL